MSKEEHSTIFDRYMKIRSHCKSLLSTLGQRKEHWETEIGKIFLGHVSFLEKKKIKKENKELGN